MAKTESADLLSSGKLAEAAGLTPAKLKKVLADLGIAPTAKKGVCAYYDSSIVSKVKAAAK